MMHYRHDHLLPLVSAMMTFGWRRVSERVRQHDAHMRDWAAEQRRIQRNLLPDDPQPGESRQVRRQRERRA